MRARLHLLALTTFRRLPRGARIRLVHVLAPAFTVGAICRLEREDGAVLLVRHAYRRRWGLPGGLLERGESAADAVVREAMEEVGVAIVVVGEPTVVVDPDPRRVDVVFAARLRDEADAARVAPRSPEILEVAWFPPDALPELQFEAAGALETLARAGGPWPGAHADH